MKKYIESMYGLEAARRVGWAKYYEKCEEAEELRRQLHSLSMLVLTHQRIHSEDEIINLAKIYRNA